jgi:broad specificity phosphatase PhoE
MCMKFLFCFVIVFAFNFLGAKEVSILLIRHGETQWNAEEKVQGHTDIPLNQKGIEQAKNTAEMLQREYPNITAIYSSDLSRAYRTAQIAAEKLHLPVVKRPSLREINAGASEGMRKDEKVQRYQKAWDELAKKYPDRKERWKHSVVPGEETIVELIERMKKEMTYIAQSTPDKSNVAVFTHGKIIQAFIADIEDKELGKVEMPNCGIIKITYNSENLLHPFCCSRIP